jgi:hypothetical protein
MLRREIFHGSSFTFYRLGRHALCAALAAINLKPKEKVLVPSFICKDLLAAIYYFEAEPIFYDVNINLEPINLHTKDQSRAVIAVNYFGFAQDLGVFFEYATKNGSLLIEDNAHGFLSADNQGEVLGCRGDVGIFSFRKTFQLPDGAGLVVNKAHSCVNSLPQQLTFDPAGLSVGYKVKKFFTKIQIKTGINFLSWLRRAFRIFRVILTGYKIPPLRDVDQYLLPSNPNPSYRMKDILFSENFDFETQRRRSLFFKSSDLLKKLRITPVFKDLGPNTCPYGYPFFAENVESAKAIKIAESMGFDCVQWPDLPNEVVNIAPDFYKKLWMINFKC